MENVYKYVLAFGPASDSPVSNLSVYQCPVCDALVVEEYLGGHIDWHEALEGEPSEDAPKKDRAHDFEGPYCRHCGLHRDFKTESCPPSNMGLPGRVPGSNEPGYVEQIVLGILTAQVEKAAELERQVEASGEANAALAAMVRKADAEVERLRIESDRASFRERRQLELSERRRARVEQLEQTVERLRRGIGCGKFSSSATEACVPLTDLMQATTRAEQLEQALREAAEMLDDAGERTCASVVRRALTAALHPDRRETT